MSQEITDMILNGFGPNQFAVLYIGGVIGALMIFLWNLYEGITLDPKTPFNWSWVHFIRGGIRVVISLVSLAFVILYFDEMSVWFFELEPGQEVFLNMKSAFFLGLGIDGLVKKLMSAGIGGAKATKKALHK